MYRPLDPAVPDPAGRFAAASGVVPVLFETRWWLSRWFTGQADTIVEPVHRGHRLGMLIKLANLKLARTQRPELRVIDTCNADSNPYMVRINEAIGFRPHRRSVGWQLLGSDAKP